MMGAMASQITSLTIVYSTVYSGVGQRKHQSSASLAFVRGIHKWPITRKMFPFDDVIMISAGLPLITDLTTSVETVFVPGSLEWCGPVFSAVFT